MIPSAALEFEEVVCFPLTLQQGVLLLLTANGSLKGNKNKLIK